MPPEKDFFFLLKVKQMYSVKILWDLPYHAYLTHKI